jgi:hypothetical protein
MQFIRVLPKMKKALPLLLLTSCSHFQSQTMTRTELFFGLSKPNGGSVSSSDFQAFADTVITKNFSEGSTIIDAKGQWLGNNGTLISESSKVLVLVSKMDKKQSEKIEMVREKYKKYFQQESVLRVDSKVKVGF